MMIGMNRAWGMLRVGLDLKHVQRGSSARKGEKSEGVCELVYDVV